ncbi:MAG: type VI secretion system contractile sheath large subunit [Bryobacterales bacterium]|nr:type VI secretion system contractile sheath large subunit [Bryobacteraceae bacterium]MDW8131446.1 type VI secretion system contractile sheath large subunit [Bryobacterales bacterium]
MPKPFHYGRLHLEAEPETQPAALLDAETPFNILVLGDFSGRANRGLCAAGPDLARRPVLRVDRDNLDQVLARLAPSLELGPHLHLEFRELEDFHPDRLYSSLEIFRRLRQTRQRMADPAMFAAAASELGVVSSPPAPEIARLTSGSLLEQVIEAAEQRGAAPTHDPLADYLRRIVAPYLVPRPHPKQQEILAQLDEAVGGLMRALLHQPAFQALEAAWRGVEFLVRRLESNGRLRIHLLDLSRQELEKDLAGADLSSTALHWLLVEQATGTSGGEAWSVMAGNFVFEQTARDAELLGRLAKLAAQAGAPFIAEAGSQAPEPSAAQAWKRLRAMPEAAWIGLALPRFLLRLPYGRHTHPIESFPFEEMPGSPQHQWYLWGSPAFACAYLLGRAFLNWGWDMRPGMVQEIADLPAHFYQEEGETRMKPCAELLLTSEAVEELLEMGFMPLVCFKNRDLVRLARFQSIAWPPKPLAGPWC